MPQQKVADIFRQSLSDFTDFFQESFDHSSSSEPRKKKLLLSFTGCLIGILMMAYCSPYVTG